ncbi:MAG: cyclic nucleotide-binding domain-containing protein [Pseudomonadota bacterium]
MDVRSGILDVLTRNEFEKIKALGSEIEFDAGEVIFSEGESAKCIYVIDTGIVSISIRKFTTEEEVCRLGQDDCFGEMALLNDQCRNASAKANVKTRLCRVDKQAFLGLVQNDNKLAEKINYLMSERSEELLLRESLIDVTGVNRKNLHVSIKGDPSLRESTFTRQRYTSVIDPILTELKSVLVDLMINRSVFQVFVGFNNGEVRTSSIFDPFCEALHPANKLVEPGYIDRHFPHISFANKIDTINNLFSAVRQDPGFDSLPANFRKLYGSYYEQWEPITQDEITSIILRLHDLRELPDFYLRNFAINLTKGAIRMQFNCDGTHIVSPDDYQRFLEENLC